MDGCWHTVALKNISEQKIFYHFKGLKCKILNLKTNTCNSPYKKDKNWVVSCRWLQCRLCRRCCVAVLACWWLVHLQVFQPVLVSGASHHSHCLFLLSRSRDKEIIWFQKPSSLISSEWAYQYFNHVMLRNVFIWFPGYYWGCSTPLQPLEGRGWSLFSSKSSLEGCEKKECSSCNFKTTLQHLVCSLCTQGGL